MSKAGNGNGGSGGRGEGGRKGQRRSPAGRPIVELQGLTKRFGAGAPAVDSADLEIMDGELFALLGPSGCGKTTLLRMIAGFETPTSGEVRLDGANVAGVPPNRRPVNMVFQSYAVFPHMSVFDNVAYGLKVTGVAAAERRMRVRDALTLVRLDELAARKPDQLSGGQRQRVALARALVKRPRVLLLDEPLSALDAKLREAMRLELVNLRKAVGITFVFVTHDQDEALSMADRIAVMEGGRVRQVADPATLYEYPNCRFVAGFIGEMNLFEATVSAVCPGELVLDAPGLGTLRVPHGAPVHGKIGIAVRPEKIHLSDAPPPGSAKADPASLQGAAPAFEATVEDFAYYGSETRVYLVTGRGVRFTATVRNTARGPVRIERGSRRFVRWNPSDTLVLTE